MPVFKEDGKEQCILCGESIACPAAEPFLRTAFRKGFTHLECFNEYMAKYGLLVKLYRWLQSFLPKLRMTRAMKKDLSRLKQPELIQVVLDVEKFTTGTQGSSLIFDDLQKVIDAFFPVLYYSTSEFIDQGYIILCKEMVLSPEFIVIHPDDLETVKSLLSSKRQLKPITEYPPEEMIHRMSMHGASCKGFSVFDKDVS